METNYDRFGHDGLLAEYMFRASCMCRLCDGCRFRKNLESRGCFFHWLGLKATLEPVKKIRRVKFDYSPYRKVRSDMKTLWFPTYPDYGKAVFPYELDGKAIELRDPVTHLQRKNRDGIHKELLDVYDTRVEPIEAVSNTSLADAIARWNKLVDGLVDRGVVKIVP